MQLSSKQIFIRRLQMEDMNSLLDLRVRNRQFFQPFEPIIADSHYSPEGQRELLEKVHQSWENGSGYGFGIFLNDNSRLVGRVNLSNVVLGAWESCTIGYFLDEAFNGRGLTTEAVYLAVQFAFGHAALHRVQGAVMPRNVGSIRVLEKAGFRYEGFSEYYLKINGKWEHHNIYSITRELWDPGKTAM
ncbi:GNAT family N-acetyltransferase [Paenibacillus sepulcri]|uniref:GNAT family N-acetyltransferase n=1 Tax=Paenibacillus sepulcri TaxID=359917 RepID=A0ABS7C3D5_9BACL|nr:GNAT family N-acetyltransferase [Paenibacillus sepulcri]